MCIKGESTFESCILDGNKWLHVCGLTATNAGTKFFNGYLSDGGTVCDVNVILWTDCGKQNLFVLD